MKKLLLLFAALSFPIILTSCNRPTPADIASNTAAVQDTRATNAPLRIFYFTATDGEYQPSTFTVNRGDKVQFNVTASGRDYGILIPGLGVTMGLPEDETITFSFQADFPGAYDFSCDLFCEGDYPEMKGTLVVQ